ncbi:MAG: hypothetical protein U0797_04510 [Gemmataceae bacterium]
MAVTTPPWLTQRGGELRLSKDGESACVYVAGQPQYLLVPVPAKGRHSCRVSETVNGRRLESAKTYATAAEALLGGLDDLRERLGW